MLIIFFTFSVWMLFLVKNGSALFVLAAGCVKTARIVKGLVFQRFIVSVLVAYGGALA